MAKTLIEVLEIEDIKLFPSGEKWKARCPFHKGDREPSLYVYPNDTYYCFGCHVWGDAVKFLVEYKRWTAAEALTFVGADYKQHKRLKSDVIKVRNTLKAYNLIRRAALTYHNHLMENSGPLEYLKSRGLTEATISQYELGYTDGSVLNLDNVEDFSLGVEVGLITKDGYERMSHRITIPNLLDAKLADFMIGRTVLNEKVKYLGLVVPKPILGLFPIRQSPILFMVEGQFDWLTLRQWGYPSIILGGNHLSKINASLLASKQIIIVPDNDTEGLKAAVKIHEQLSNSIILKWDDKGQKDISGYASAGNPREPFDETVKEQLGKWIQSSSTKTLTNYLPPSATPDYLALT